MSLLPPPDLPREDSSHARPAGLSLGRDSADMKDMELIPVKVQPSGMSSAFPAPLCVAGRQPAANRRLLYSPSEKPFGIVRTLICQSLPATRGIPMPT